jgi:hypothetical protein
MCVAGGREGGAGGCSFLASLLLLLLLRSHLVGLKMVTHDVYKKREERNERTA